MSSYSKYLSEALKHPITWGTFTLFSVITLVTFTPFPFLLGAALTAGWLISAPLIPAFRNHVQKKKMQENERGTLQEKYEVLSLPPDMQRRFNSLKTIANSIRRNYETGSETNAAFLEQIAGRVDEILGRFLDMLKAYITSEKHVQANKPGGIQDKITALDAEIENADDALADALYKQRDILQKRYERALKAEKDHRMLGVQLETLEDLVKLLNDQAVSMTKPEEITTQLDSIMSELEVTAATVEELELSFESSFDRELEEAEKKKRLT